MSSMRPSALFSRAFIGRKGSVVGVRRLQRLLPWRMLFGCAPGLMMGCTSSALRVGDRAPDFRLTSVDGRAVQLSGFLGKPVLLSFWAYG